MGHIIGMKCIEKRISIPINQSVEVDLGNYFNRNNYLLVVYDADDMELLAPKIDYKLRFIENKKIKITNLIMKEVNFIICFKS